MFLFYLKLAAKSLRATPLVTLLTILAIGLGIAVPAAMLSIHHVFAQDPIPEKSDRLFNVRVDSWSADSEFFDVAPGDPPKHITYQDMAGLMETDRISLHRTGVATARAFVFPDNRNVRPYQTAVTLCHADLFPMFDAPFRYGGGWDRSADARRERVVVLSAEANDKLFGGIDSVGRKVRLGTQELTVIGVLDRWRLTPNFYDILNNAFGQPREMFIPFDSLRDQDFGLTRSGQSDSWGNFSSDDPDAFFTASEATWIQYWVEVPPERIDDYRAFVDAFTAEQKKLGRYPRPKLNNRVESVMEWMRTRNVVPQASRAMVIISLLFLAVCCLNLTALLLGKFLAKSGTLGVHRSLGASRFDIFFQRLLECEVVGVAGGAVGLGLAALSMWLLGRSLPPQITGQGVFSADGFTVAMALVLAMLAGVVSGLYPAWRACRIAPAIQLKLQ